MIIMPSPSTIRFLLLKDEYCTEKYRRFINKAFSASKVNKSTAS